MRARLLVALAVMLPCVAAHAASDDTLATPDRVIRGFVAALPSVSLGELAPYCDLSVGAPFSGIEAMFDHRTCIDVRAWSYTATRISDREIDARIHLEGIRATASGAIDPLRDVNVIIERTGQRWSITACYTPEQWTANQLFEAATDDERQCILERSGLDPAAVIRAAADRGDYAHAAPASERMMAFCLRWAREHHDVLTEAECSRLLAAELMMTGDPAGRAIADRAVELARQGNGADELAHALLSRGLGFWTVRTDLAIADLQEAADLLPRLHDRQAAFKALYMKVYIEKESGEYRAALLDDQRLQAMAESDRWAEGVALAMWQMGDIHASLRNVEVAREYHRKVQVEFQREGNTYYAQRALADLAVDEMDLGRLDAAHEMLTRVVNETTQDKYIFAELVTLLTVSHRNRELETLFGRLGDFGMADPAIASQFLMAHGSLAFAKRHYLEAERDARDSIRRSAQAGGTMHWPPWPAQRLLGDALRTQGHYRAAAAAYRDAIATIERESESMPSDELGRLRYVGDKVEPYRALATLLAERQDATGALTVAESVRARALREVLNEGKIDIRRDLTDQERTRDQELAQRVSDIERRYLTAPDDSAPAIRPELDRARTDLADFEAQLGVEHAVLRSAPQPRRQDIDAAMSRLRAGELVVEYMTGPKQTLAFLITRGGVSVRSLPVAQTRLDHLTRQFAAALARRDMRYVPVSRALYDALIAPLQPAIQRHRDVCFIPDGALWRVPFETLRDRHGVPLIDRNTISYAPSALILAEMRMLRPKRDLPQLLAFGNPAVDGLAKARVRSIERDATLGALPEAAEEVQRIGALYAGSEVYVGNAARETTLKTKAPHFRIIHVAAHGFVEDRSPLYSCVVLAPGDGNDGLLEMREVVDMKLNADLVVLSSCDTARGKIAPGEGVVGLAWAFLAAGCPSTVVSQWKVDSAATEQLMVAFHRRLVRNGLRDKAAALRAAKLALRRDPRYRHPYYWAPFIVVGDGR